MAALASNLATHAVGYLVLDTLPTTLALPAKSIIDIAPFKEELPEQLRPFSELVPIRFAALDPRWVLHVVVEDLRCAILVSGAVHLAYLSADSLLVMPQLHRQHHGLFSELVLTDGKPSALVVNIDALFQVHRELDT